MGNWHEAEVSLRQADSIISGIIDHTGPCELIKHEGGFAGLASSITWTATLKLSCKKNPGKVPEAL